MKRNMCLRNERDIFDANGGPTLFEIYRIDENGKRLSSKNPVANGAAKATETAEHDERRRTIITFYDLPLELCGHTMVDGTLASTVAAIERAQFTCVGIHADRVNVNQPVIKGRIESKLTVYT